MPLLDTLTKRIVLISLLAITALQIALHPDATTTLRAAAALALAIGWIAGRRTSEGGHALWLFLAPLVPAVVFATLGRQGTVADLLWMAGLTASLIRASSWSGWALPPAWRILLGGWALVLSLAWPVLIARELSFDVRNFRDVTDANSWAMMPAPHVVVWTLYVIQTQLVGLLWFEWIYSRFTATALRPPRIVHAIWIGVSLASVVALVQGTVNLSLLNTPFWINARRAAGTMVDANAYGTVAALAGPVAFLALRSAGLPSAVGLAVLALNWTGVWMSGSRTGELCALLGGAGLAIGLIRSRAISVRRLALAGAVVVILVAIGIFSARIDSPIARLVGKEGPQRITSLWDRGGYGTIAMRMVREYPVTGVGAGGYRYLAPDYWRVMQDMQLQPDNAQNWWRHQLAELGVSGSAFVLLWSLLIAWHVLFARAKPEARLHAWTARGLLLGIGACSLVGMPTQNPVVLLWFFFLIAWMSAVCVKVPDTPRLRPAWIRVGAAAAVLFAIAHVTGHGFLANGRLAVIERARRFPREYVAGAYGMERLPEGHPFRWTDDRSEFILPATYRWLVVRIWAHHPDIAQHPVVVSLSSPCRLMFQHELRSTEPVTIGITIAPGVETLDATVTASRTWKPADYGGQDPRELGVAVLTDFAAEPEGANQEYRATWGACPR